MDINLSDREIAKMKESKYKSLVEKAVTRKELAYLNTTADNHSKSRILIKSKLEREQYFDNQRFSRSEVELLFALRTRMIDLKSNLSNKYGNDVLAGFAKYRLNVRNTSCEV